MKLRDQKCSIRANVTASTRDILTSWALSNGYDYAGMPAWGKLLKHMAEIIAATGTPNPSNPGIPMNDLVQTLEVHHTALNDTLHRESEATIYP